VDREVTQVALAGVGVEFGATRLLADVTLTVARGDRWGIIGRNGSGKTTLFRLITGEQAPTSGTIARGSGLRISLMEQHREFAGAETVWDAAAGGFAELLGVERSLAAQAAELAGTTATSSDSIARAATPSPRGSMRCCTAWASIPTRPAGAR
jgi:ATP-binding cassette subfamily F protein 3